MQEWLTKLCDVVHKNLEKAQAEQKKWYDPYPVIRKIGGVNYEIKMTDRKKQKRIFHINMLRQWNSPSTMS